MCREKSSESSETTPSSGGRADENDGALVFAEAALHEEGAQPQPERVAMGEPPIDRFALGLDAIPPAEFD
jgi:hypothetical protein